MVCNRDERRDRPAATPPQLRCQQDRTAIFPVDPVGAGTWVGVNEAGLAATLLNRTMDGAVRRQRAACSRGSIVPSVLAHGSLRRAIAAAERLDPTSFEPFRLVLVHGFTVGVVNSDGYGLSRKISRMSAPLLFTSSSLGDALVEEPRRRLFERQVVADQSGWLCGQFRFHRHQWMERPEISVCMERSDALTVSRTVIDVSSRAIQLCYEPLGSGSVSEKWEHAPSRPASPAKNAHHSKYDRARSRPVVVEAA